MEIAACCWVEGFGLVGNVGLVEMGWVLGFRF
jgi:hypothetical protein